MDAVSGQSPSRSWARTGRPSAGSECTVACALMKPEAKQVKDTHTHTRTHTERGGYGAMKRLSRTNECVWMRAV